MGCTLGRVTRDHGDIDWFTWADGAHGLTGELLRLGCTEVPGPPAALRRGFATGGLESGFTPVDRDHLGRSVVAAGRWAGTPWPRDPLDGGPGRTGGLSCPVVAPRAGTGTKPMIPVWDTALPAGEGRGGHRPAGAALGVVARRRDAGVVGVGPAEDAHSARLGPRPCRVVVHPARAPRAGRPRKARSPASRVPGGNGRPAVRAGRKAAQCAPAPCRGAGSSAAGSMGAVTSSLSRPWPLPRWLKTRLSRTAATQPVEMPESRMIFAVSGKAW
ncbi:hypothetical protein EES47_17690 [Streptomyces sp. ADI98-12]|nr:hypothetical protein EES47_17690 [Streptomyces sp. ADI98-12]